MPLKYCKDLDVPMFRLLTESLRRHLEMDLFGFDVLVETGTKNVYICDVNYLPGYKGVPAAARRLGECLMFLATRRASDSDRRSLRPQDFLALATPSSTNSDV